MLNRNTTNRQHRTLTKLARDLRKLIQSLRLSINTLRRGFKNWSKHDEVSTACAGRTRFSE